MSDYKTANANWHTINIGGVTLIGDLPSDHLSLFIEDDTLGIRTGVAIGPVSIAIDVLPGEPRPEGQGDWEDIAETSVEASDPMTISGPWDDHPAHALDLAPGPWRLRVNARGRETAYDEAVESATETYLLQLWRAEIGPTLPLKSTTRDLTD